MHFNDAEMNGVALKCSNVTWERQAFQPVTISRPGPRGLTTNGNTPGTGISGLSATERVLSAPSRNMALKTITFGERNDRPCYLEAVFWTDNPTQSTRTVTFNECNGNHGSERSVDIPTSFDNVQLASTLRICQRQQNDRLKGIHVRGSRVDANGATPDEAISDQEARTNCNDWNGFVHCTQGSVITGLRVHFRPSQNRPAEIVGLGMNCSSAEHP